MKKRYFFGLLAMLLALTVTLAGCDLFDLDGDDDPQTISLKITGKDSKERSVVVEFTRTVSAPVTAVKAVTMELRNDDNYEISVDAKEVSSGKIAVDNSNSKITFKPDSGTTFTGTYGGGLDLAFTMTGVIDDFYVPGETKVRKPVASSSAAQNDKAKPDDTVTLSCDTSGAVIRYTIGDSLPNSASDVYTKGTTVIKVKYEDGKPFIVNAIAAKGDMAQSETLTQKYSNNAEKPSFTPDSENVSDGSTVKINSTDGAKIYWAYTTNGDTPPIPTPSDITGSSDGVTKGTANSFPITFSGDKPIIIRAIAYKNGMTSSDVSTMTYRKKTGTSDDAIKDQFGADDDLINTDDWVEKGNISITGPVRATRDITIEAGKTYIIESGEGQLTVPVGKTININGGDKKGTLDVQGKLVVEGSINIGSGGILDIKADGKLSVSGGVTVLSGGVLNIIVGTTTTTIEGNGTITVKSGGKMYIPDIEKSGDKITLTVTGAIEVEKDGELYLVGKDGPNDVWWPWIGTAKSKGIDVTNEVGADFVITSGKITLKGNNVPTNQFVPYMFLYGDAMVLGIEKYPKPTTPVREEVNLPYMFTVSDGCTLTIGSTTQPGSTLNITAGYTLINNGTVILNKDSVIKATNANAIIGKVLDADRKEIQYKLENEGWKYPPTAAQP